MQPCHAEVLEAAAEPLEPSAVSELWVTQLPKGSYDIENLVFHPEKFQWEIVKNGSTEQAQANSTMIYRARIPQFTQTRILLRRPFVQSINSEGIGLRFFVNDTGNLVELRPVKDRYVSVAIDRRYAGQEIFITNVTGPFNTHAPLYLLTYSEEDHLDLMKVEQRYIGYVLGMLGIMALYNIGMMLLFRNKYLFYYVCYTVSAMLQFSFSSGLLGFTGASYIMYYMSSYFAGTFIVLFSMEMLSIKKSDKKLYYTGFMLIFAFTFAVSAILLGSRFATKSFMLFGPLIFFYSFFLTARSAYQGNKPAYTMLVGWLCLLVAFTLVALQSFVVDLPAEVGWALPIAAAIEVATFSFAMGQKLRLSELKVMRENEHAFEEMRKMVYPHQLEQIRGGDKLENSMPTHTAQACVLSFDIVGSSKIKHVKAKDFFRNVFARCNATMNEGYDGVNLRARAYRIKEMGDGFLCSIGYPFASVSDNPANDAVELAEKFALILSEESSILHAPEPVTCGIGIAIDTLVGFYPESGTKEYDLFGRGLVLATRYEGMRKCLFESEKRHSILIIQELVYLGLDADHQNGFKVLNVKELGIVVRDDPAAVKVYYKLIAPSAAEAREEERQRKAI
jgi:class 3 adenylate cyclase